MHGAPRFALVTAPVAAMAMLVTLGACGGSKTPMSSPGDKPAEISAEPEPVDVCGLLHPRDVTESLGLQVATVSLQYGAPQVPTLACGLGTEFGVPEVTVQLATGPISRNVFDDAYGRSAGGDPELVKDLGEAAYFRNAPETMQIRALVNGAILTLEVANDPANPRDQKDIVALARAAADRLPDNPRLAPTSAGAKCAQAPDEAITQAIGTAASVTSSLAGDDGSLMCSWAARPGVVVLSIVRSAARIASYRELMDENLYTTVEEVEAPKGINVVSRTDKAGDLLIFDGDRAMAVMNVVPTAGFSDKSVYTTPGEIQLANGVIASML